jgi:hypothetical protein
MLVHANVKIAETLRNNPKLDREASLRLATRLFPKEKLVAIGDGDLSNTFPPDNELHVGCFPGISILAAREFGIDRPSTLPERFITAGSAGTTYLHAMHSVVDWLAFAQWTNGKLVRSLSLSPDSGLMEDIGARLPFEQPFWSGEQPSHDDEDDEYPFPFHPLEMGEAALRDFFGYQLEGEIDPQLLEPESIPLLKFKRVRSWWKLW